MSVELSPSHQVVARQGGRFRRRLVRIFDRDPALLRAVPAELAERVRQRVILPSLVVPQARRGYASLRRSEARAIGWLVLEGVLAVRESVSGRSASTLVGPGDVLIADEASLTIRALQTSLLAVLDPTFERTLRQVPGLAAELLRRTAARTTLTAKQLALAQLPRLEDRLLAVMTEAGERWGWRDGNWLHLDASMSHGLLAEMVGARRPSVSTVLSDLRARGVVQQTESGLSIRIRPA